MNFTIKGQILERIHFGYVLQLTFSDGYGIQAGTSIVLNTPAGATVIEPGVDDDSSPLVALIGERVLDLVANESGALDVQFTGDARLHIEPDSRFEAWTLFGPKQLKVVSLPGGGISVWSPRDGSGRS